mmetsp:Transcript_2582/g.6920  ORF Transcript_2582/g.6920 Transcript_2582/m.6920 type:complete len:468 (+) Transcript_2582:1652-3055(+)
MSTVGAVTHVLPQPYPRARAPVGSFFTAPCGTVMPRETTGFGVHLCPAHDDDGLDDAHHRIALRSRTLSRTRLAALLVMAKRCPGARRHSAPISRIPSQHALAPPLSPVQDHTCARLSRRGAFSDVRHAACPTTRTLGPRPNSPYLRRQCRHTRPTPPGQLASLHSCVVFLSDQGCGAIEPKKYGAVHIATATHAPPVIPPEAIAFAARPVSSVAASAAVNPVRRDAAWLDLVQEHDGNAVARAGLCDGRAALAALRRRGRPRRACAASAAAAVVSGQRRARTVVGVRAAARGLYAARAEGVARCPLPSARSAVMQPVRLSASEPRVPRRRLPGPSPDDAACAAVRRSGAGGGFQGGHHLPRYLWVPRRARGPSGLPAAAECGDVTVLLWRVTVCVWARGAAAAVLDRRKCGLCCAGAAWLRRRAAAPGAAGGAYGQLASSGIRQAGVRSGGKRCQRQRLRDQLQQH